MYRRDDAEHADENLPDIAGSDSVRRGRRFTPPGLRVPHAWLRRPRRNQAPATVPVRIGEVVAELTPRQAVVWLMNLDTMVSLYESTTEHRLDQAARGELVDALRSIVRDSGQQR
jgi:hypothetical protein